MHGYRAWSARQRRVVSRETFGANRQDAHLHPPKGQNSPLGNLRQLRLLPSQSYHTYIPSTPSPIASFQYPLTFNQPHKHPCPYILHAHASLATPSLHPSHTALSRHFLKNRPNRLRQKQNHKPLNLRQTYTTHAPNLHCPRTRATDFTGPAGTCASPGKERNLDCVHAGQAIHWIHQARLL